MDKYLANLANTGSPPMTPRRWTIGIGWTGLPKWQGGRQTPSRNRLSNASRYLNDPYGPERFAHLRRPVAHPRQRSAGAFLVPDKGGGAGFLVSLRHFDAAGTWMSGRNLDIVISGDGSWQLFERTITEFPEGARSCAFAAYPTTWSDTGNTTGALCLTKSSSKTQAPGSPHGRGRARGRRAGQLQPVSIGPPGILP